MPFESIWESATLLCMDYQGSFISELTKHPWDYASLHLH